MVEYDNNGKISSFFGIDLKKMFEQLEDHVRDIDDNVLDAIKKINKKIDDAIPDKREDSNPRDAI